MMTSFYNSKAAIPNPALRSMAILIGEWKTTGSHPYLPGVVLNGNVSFRWMEGGAFMIMHSHVGHKDFPDGIAIFGNDGGAEDFTMLYYDEREIARIYTVSFQDRFWKWWRNDPAFSQRFSCTISEDGNTMVGKGEMSQKGGPWEGDLELSYARIVNG